MRKNEFEENLMKSNVVMLVSDKGFPVMRFAASEVLNHIYSMAGEIHEKLVNRDTPMIVAVEDGKERCPVCGCKVKKRFCPRCGQRLIYQEGRNDE